MSFERFSLVMAWLMIAIAVACFTFLLWPVSLLVYAGVLAFAALLWALVRICA